MELIVFLLLVERSFPRRLSLENESAGVAARVRRWRDKNGTRESRGARRLLSLSRLADAVHGVATPLERRSNNSRFEEQRRWSSTSSGSPLLVTREKGWGKEERSEVGAEKSFAITHNGSRRVWRIVNRLTLSQLSFLANERAGQSEREDGEIKRLRKRKNELQWAGRGTEKRKWGKETSWKSERNVGRGRKIDSARVVRPRWFEMFTSSMRNARSIWLFLTSPTRHVIPVIVLFLRRHRRRRRRCRSSPPCPLGRRRSRRRSHRPRRCCCRGR